MTILQREEELDIQKISYSELQRNYSLQLKIKFCQTMIQKRKNISNFNDLFDSFASSCFKIVDKHQLKMHMLTSDGVKSMQTQFQSYQLEKKKLVNQTQITKADSEAMTGYSVKKKQFSEDTNTHPSHKNPFQATLTKSKNNKDHHGETAILSERISKMNLECDYLLDNIDEDDEPTKKPNEMQELKNMSIVEILQASNKKIMEKNNKVEPVEDESQYEMTDYSSNESSNDGDYEAHYGDEDDNKPLFGGLFSKGISNDTSNSTGSLFPTLKFSAKELLKSPKKYPKNKRLFVGSKKVPRWAENLEIIAKQQNEQKFDDAQKNFGICIVENLNTNVIFEKELEIKRTSSAKWNPRMFLE